jgi:hypothetical protein
MTNYIETAAWAKKLTDEQLTAAVHELRERGYAVSCYGPTVFEEMFEGHEGMENVDWEDLIDTEALEDMMSDTAFNYAMSIAQS